MFHKPFQYILLAILVVLLFLFLPRLRKVVTVRILFLAAIVVGIVFTIVPQLSTMIANYLGVGRGVDLVLYLGMVILVCACLLLYLRSEELARKQEELARALALLEEEVRQGRSN